MTGASGDTGRDYRFAARGMRMWRRVLGLTVALALIAGAGAAGWKTWRAATAHEWYSVRMLVLAETLIAVGIDPHRSKDVRYPGGRTGTVTLGAIADHQPLLALRRRMIADLLDAALLGLGTAAGIVVLAIAALHYMSGRLKRGRRLRGGEPVRARGPGRRVPPLHPRALRPRRIVGVLRSRIAERFAARKERDAPGRPVAARDATLPDRTEEARVGAERELHAGSKAGAPERGATVWPDEAVAMIGRLTEADAATGWRDPDRSPVADGGGTGTNDAGETGTPDHPRRAAGRTADQPKEPKPSPPPADGTPGRERKSDDADQNFY